MEECLIIVGRARTAKKFTEIFAESIIENLNENQFEIDSVESLGDLSELDGLSRFIAFVLIDDDSKYELKLKNVFSTLMGLQMGVRKFESLESAKAYAKENYNYMTVVEEEEIVEEEEGEIDEEMIRITAEEIEDFMIFESLFRTGKLATIKGTVYGESATVMAQIIFGPDQIRITPYAVMVNPNILENMELPEIDERDD